jgi:hypothetical protein
MAFYQSLKTAKAAAMGTIMPWTGGLSDIPEGWILCNGGTVAAKDYPLLSKSIGDSYNESATSDFGGSFPNYNGSITIPNLNNKNLMDIETSYFGTGSGSTGNSADEDSTATSLIQPLIGTHSDNGVETIINDALTDVVFELNDTTGYSGKITGNVIEPGFATKSVYIGPRKLGRDHLKSHNHSGSFETLSGASSTRPGLGVIPWDNISYEFKTTVNQPSPQPPGGSPDEDQWIFEWEMINEEDGRSGFDNGIAGRVVAGIEGENPPVNATPFNVTHTPITSNGNDEGEDNPGFINDNRFDGGDTIGVGLFGSTVTVPAGQKNYYPDLSVNDNYGTLLSNPGTNFLTTSQTAGVSDQIQAHFHDLFDVEFDTASMRPLTSLNVPVTAPNTNVNLDNASNEGALQINFNTVQPSLNTVYIIRAY